MVAKIPHGNPQRISPTSSTALLGAKKTMKRQQLRVRRAPMRVLRGPKAVTSQPFRIPPKKAPTPDDWPSPDCQPAVSWYPLGVCFVTPTKLPYFRWNEAGKC